MNLLKKLCFIILILVCSSSFANSSPQISGPFSYIIYPGQQLCFTINTNDSDLSDTTRIYWDKKIPDATFSDNNGIAKHASTNICWTPIEDDASCLPYIFFMTVVDDHGGSHTQEYSIFVKPILRSAQVYTKINCHTYQFKNIPINRKGCLANQLYITRWGVLKLTGTGSTVYFTGDSIRYDFKEGGRYRVNCSLTSDGNMVIYFDTLNIDSFAAVNIINDDLIIKPNDSVVLYAETKNNRNPNQYQWWANGKLIDTLFSITVHPKASTTYTLINKSLSAPCEITEDNVSIILAGTSGINPFGSPKIYPFLTNPFNTYLLINNDQNEFLEYYLYSVDGKIISSAKITNELFRIETPYLLPGIYILELTSGERREQYKVIKW